MLDTKKFGQIITLFSVVVGAFVPTASATLTAVPATATSHTVRAEKLKQEPSVILASSNEGSRSQPQARVKLEELKNLPRYMYVGNAKYPDSRFNDYNRTVRQLQLLPSKGQSLEIRTKDSPVQRLLKQQLNGALESHQMVGQLLDAGKLGAGNPARTLNDLMAMTAVQVALSEANLAANPTDRRAASEICLKFATVWERDAMSLDRAGLGTRRDVLIASYWRLHCEALTMSSQKNASSPSSTRESQQWQQSYISLEGFERSAAGLPNKDNNHDRLVNYYKANVSLLQKLNSRLRSPVILTEDRDVQRLQKQQLINALEIYRLQGLRLTAGVLGSDDAAEIMLPAVQVAIADMHLATNPTDRAVSNEVCLEITQAWEKEASTQKNPTLAKPLPVLTAPYWKRYCEIQKATLRAGSAT